jgi:hypothetical protein
MMRGNRSMSQDITPLCAHTRSEARPVRTFHACEDCRLRKMKCNGGFPCSRCMSGRTPRKCVYGMRSHARIVLPDAPQTEKNRRQMQTDVPSPHREGKELDYLSYPLGDSPLATSPVLDRLRVGVSVYNADTDICQFYGPSSHFWFVQHLFGRLQRNTNSPPYPPPYSPGSLRDVPEALRAWGMEKQLFTNTEELGKEYNLDQSRTRFLPKDLGQKFISAYFDVVHPRAPVLSEVDIYKSWEELWSPPNRSTPPSNLKARSILFMVFAIGALQCPDEGDDAMGWAQHFSKSAGDMSGIFEEPSIVDIHLLLLRAIYALQVGKTNCHYL